MGETIQFLENRTSAGFTSVDGWKSRVLSSKIDISAFILADGTSLSVLGDWNGGNSRLMRQLHASACGPFRTVLGPNSDRHHRDHFHFDVAQHRGGGTYCR